MLNSELIVDVELMCVFCKLSNGFVHLEFWETLSVTLWVGTGLNSLEKGHKPKL